MTSMVCRSQLKLMLCMCDSVGLSLSENVSCVSFQLMKAKQQQNTSSPHPFL